MGEGSPVRNKAGRTSPSAGFRRAWPAARPLAWVSWAVPGLTVRQQVTRCDCGCERLLSATISRLQPYRRRPARSDQLPDRYWSPDCSS